MKKTSIMILLAGFVFIYFTLPFSGIDLLIDAVGFLLLWNGLRGLQKAGVNTGLAAPLCLLLVLVASGQLFVGGAFYTVLTVLRSLAEAVLLFFILQGLLPLANGPRYRILLQVIFTAAVVLAFSTIAFSLLPALAFVQILHSVLAIAVPAVLLVSLVVFSNTLSET